ncbi:MAG: hypothetical protein KGI06_00340 [Candidatus Micrarchaeota archaeon]|nr:hypothetical protein [Candidatus Micrarchaeota archaeon]
MTKKQKSYRPGTSRSDWLFRSWIGEEISRGNANGAFMKLRQLSQSGITDLADEKALNGIGSNIVSKAMKKGRLEEAELALQTTKMVRHMLRKPAQQSGSPATPS